MANEATLNSLAPQRWSSRIPHWPKQTLKRLASNPWLLASLAVLAVILYWSATNSTPTAVLQLLHWMPALLRGLRMHVELSVMAVALGTFVGLFVGALTISPLRSVRTAAQWYVQIFRNAPVLVLVYFTTYVFPFELQWRSWSIPFPDWIKVVLGLALPCSAVVAEIFRGAIQSIPSAQWEAAHSLAFKRTQVFRLIVLPQCLRRMLPPWMNLYASITMSTSLASLVGVHDVVDTAQIASNTVARTDFTILVYFTLLVLFFAYCYPIARATRALERRNERY